MNECVHQRHTTWKDAIADYTAAWERGEVIAHPKPGTRYWTKPLEYPRPSSSRIPSLTPSEDGLWESIEGLDLGGG